MTPTSAIRFHPFRLDLVSEQLECGREIVALRPKAFALLRYLALNAGALVTKEALLDTVWSGRIVTEGGLTELIRELRKVLGDDARSPRFIETVHGKGYRFIAPIETAPTRAGTVDTAHDVSRQTGVSAVGRESEWERLHALYQMAAGGTRQVVFISGEPGIGKTTLVNTFVRRVASGDVTRDERPRVGLGQCIEQYGAGEAYLPVLETLGRLARYTDGELLADVLRRHAPTWVRQLPALFDTGEIEESERRAAGATRERMLREMAEALDAYSQDEPLVLVLEDLHWSDYSTLDLVSYIAQRTGMARVLLLATFRPVEVHARDHPLGNVVQELRARAQCQELSLGCLDGAAVQDYLEQRFPDSHHAPSIALLAPAVHRRTDGHPLFMVNVADYVEALNFEGLPDSVLMSVPDNVRALIEKQLARLSPDQRRLLEAAAIAGAEFSAASVAAAMDESDIDSIEEMCSALASRDQFLAARGAAEWPDGTFAARYGFIHAVYQNVVYFSVPPGKRARLHERIARREELAWGSNVVEIAGELATHFEAARNFPQAVKYYTLAGGKAVRNWADREAIDLYSRALDLLSRMTDTRERQRDELQISIALGVPLIHVRGYAAGEVGRVYGRARELQEAVGEPAQRLPVLWGLWLYYVVFGDHRTARSISGQLIDTESAVAERFPLAHYAAGCSSFWMADLELAVTELEQALAIYDPVADAASIDLYSQDPRVVSLLYRGWALWTLGYPDKARASCAEAIGWAERIAHPFTSAFAHNFFAVLLHLLREHDSARAEGEAALSICTEHGFELFKAWATMMCGRGLVDASAPEKSIEVLRTGLDEYESTGARMGKTLWLALHADALHELAQPDAGMKAVADARAFCDATGEQAFSAELYRLEGELVLLADPRGGTAKAEQCFQTALATARAQKAKSWELRSAMSLARLWSGQGKREESRALLEAVCGWFSEGFETVDRRQAVTLLETLKS